MDSLRRLERLDYIIRILSIFIFIVFWLVVITFPSFFFFNPFNEPDTVRKVELALSTFGWISLSTLVPLLLFVFSEGMRRVRNLVLFFGMIYPVSLIASQITIFMREGKPYLGYLWDFPIFIFTDVILPILVIFLWHDLKEKTPLQKSV
jgi:hypothetical protein